MTVDVIGAAWSLIPLSIVLGIALLWAFGRLSNQRAIRETRRRMSARMYELRLFVDEPLLILKAQGALLLDSAKHLGLMLVPVAILSIPMVLLFGQLDAFYGFAPLEPGRSALVTVQLTRPIDRKPELALPDGFVADAPAVRAFSLRQVTWRIRPVRAASGELHLAVGGESAVKSISAEPGLRYLSKRRVNSVADLLRYPAEPKLKTANIAWIDVDYPPAEVKWLGVELNWLVWFLIVSTVTALVLSRRFGVSF